ncbi:addiction module toxin RelE [Candidatus Woesearchaeota archaeon]|nr:addiction module toxin RelE [Candidatus Woesearchaeota archaeon]
MRKVELGKTLKKILLKLEKKDNVKYSIVLNKFDEIVNCTDIDHCKNLRSPLQEFKRVHINGSFVLLFRYDKQNDLVIFWRLCHHDEVYK